MTEIHGWITLRYSDYHSEDTHQNEFVAKFKSYLNQHYAWISEDSRCSFSSRNGLESFAVNVLHNHKGDPFHALAIFTWVANESTGSYGLLYFLDDEDEARFNEFQVYVLKRGKLVKAQDSFLSPYCEEVEKKYDEDNPPLD